MRRSTKEQPRDSKGVGKVLLVRKTTTTRNVFSLNHHHHRIGSTLMRSLNTNTDHYDDFEEYHQPKVVKKVDNKNDETMTMMREKRKAMSPRFCGARS